MGIILTYTLFSEAATRDVIWKKVYLKICKFHRKTPVLDSLFKRVAGLKINTGAFLWKFAKFLRTSILKNIWERLLLFYQMQFNVITCKTFFILSYNANLKKTSFRSTITSFPVKSIPKYSKINFSKIGNQFTYLVLMLFFISVPSNAWGA